MTSDVKRSDHSRITGELCGRLVLQAQEKWVYAPESLYFFALWQALSSIGDCFEDEQGIRMTEARRIESLIGDSLFGLVQAGGMEKDTEASRRLLGELLAGLAKLRNLSPSE